MTEPAQSPAGDDLLRVFLSGRDAECPFCGYNLRDLASDQCPECGERVRLSLQAVNAKIGWAVAGLMGLTTGAGFSLLMSIFFITLFMRRSFADHHMWMDFWMIMVLPLTIQSMLVWWWLRRWGWLRRLPLAQRIMAAGAAWFVPLLNIIIFSIYLK